MLRELREAQAEQMLDAGVGVDAAAGGGGDEDTGWERIAERLDRRSATTLARQDSLEGGRSLPAAISVRSLSE
ncbi:MAG: hypothetical protein ABIT71_04905 [Vicinamibacteraceae bacterium]